MDKSRQVKKRRQQQLILKMKCIIKKYQYQRRQKLIKTIPTNMKRILSSIYEHHLFHDWKKAIILNRLWKKRMTSNSFWKVKSTSDKFYEFQSEDVIRLLYMLPNLEIFDCSHIRIPSTAQLMKNLCRNFYARVPNLKQFKNINAYSLMYTQAYIHDLHLDKKCNQISRYDLQYSDNLRYCPTYCYTLCTYLAPNLTSLSLSFLGKRAPLDKEWGNLFPCLKELAIDSIDRTPLWKEYVLYIIGILSGSLPEPTHKQRDAFTILMGGGEPKYDVQRMQSFLNKLTSIMAPMNVRLSKNICAANASLIKLHQTSLMTSSLYMLPITGSKLTHLRIDYERWSAKCRRDFETYLHTSGNKLTHLEVNLHPTDGLILNVVTKYCVNLQSLTFQMGGELKKQDVDWQLFITLTFGKGKFRSLKCFRVKRKRVPVGYVSQIANICPDCKIIEGNCQYNLM